MNRDELLEFMAEAMGINALDRLVQGIDDPDFDPERPYRGKLKFEDLPEMTRMLIEMNEKIYELSDARFRRVIDDSIITTFRDSTTGL
jgi:hypothetical protein